jgi:hypothetical protein
MTDNEYYMIEEDNEGEQHYYQPPNYETHSSQHERKRSFENTNDHYMN